MPIGIEIDPSADLDVGVTKSEYTDAYATSQSVERKKEPTQPMNATKSRIVRMLERVLPAEDDIMCDIIKVTICCFIHH